MKHNTRSVAKIIGTGRAVPDRILTNADFEKMVDTSDEWITTRTGIKQRHVAEAGTANSDLCAEAAKKAMVRANITPEEIDVILIGTVTGDRKFPSNANYVQAKIGAANAASMDISAACSGFLYGIHLAKSLIASDQAKTILVIGAEILSSMTNYEDRATCVLFGDGAGAMILQANEEINSIRSSYIGSNGELAHLLYCPGGGSIMPAKNRDLPSDVFTAKMAGNEVFKHAVKTMEQAARTALDRAGLTASDIQLLIPHQANIRIIDATAKRLGIPREKVYINIHNYGNTSAASIPIALDEAIEKGVAKKGDLVVGVAFGGGFTWGSVVFEI